jgi:hypothetical protein
VLLREIAHGVASVLRRPSIEILDHSGSGSPAGIRRDREVQKLSGAVDRDWTAVYGCRPAVVLVTELAPRRLSYCRSAEQGSSSGYQDDHEVCLGPRPVRDPRGQGVSAVDPSPGRRTQQLDISEKNYRALKLQNMGKTLKKRGRKPGSTTKATKAASTPPTRRRRQSNKRPATA